MAKFEALIDPTEVAPAATPAPPIVPEAPQSTQRGIAAPPSWLSSRLDLSQVPNTQFQQQYARPIQAQQMQQRQVATQQAAQARAVEKFNTMNQRLFDKNYKEQVAEKKAQDATARNFQNAVVQKEALAKGIRTYLNPVTKVYEPITDENGAPVYQQRETDTVNEQGLPVRETRDEKGQMLKKPLFAYDTVNGKFVAKDTRTGEVIREANPDEVAKSPYAAHAEAATSYKMAKEKGSRLASKTLSESRATAAKTALDRFYLDNKIPLSGIDKGALLPDEEVAAIQKALSDKTATADDKAKMAYHNLAKNARALEDQTGATKAKLDELDGPGMLNFKLGTTQPEAAPGSSTAVVAPQDVAPQANASSTTGFAAPSDAPAPAEPVDAVSSPTVPASYGEGTTSGQNPPVPETPAQAERNKLRSNPATAKHAERLDAIDKDAQKRMEKAMSEDSTPEVKQAKLDAINSDAETQYGAAAQMNQLEYEQEGEIRDKIFKFQAANKMNMEKLGEEDMKGGDDYAAKKAKFLEENGLTGAAGTVQFDRLAMDAYKLNEWEDPTKTASRSDYGNTNIAGKFLGALGEAGYRSFDKMAGGSKDRKEATDSVRRLSDGSFVFNPHMAWDEDLLVKKLDEGVPELQPGEGGYKNVKPTEEQKSLFMNRLLNVQAQLAGPMLSALQSTSQFNDWFNVNEDRYKDPKTGVVLLGKGDVQAQIVKDYIKSPDAKSSWNWIKETSGDVARAIVDPFVSASASLWGVMNRKLGTDVGDFNTYEWDMEQQRNLAQAMDLAGQKGFWNEAMTQAASILPAIGGGGIGILTKGVTASIGAKIAAKTATALNAIENTTKLSKLAQLSAKMAGKAENAMLKNYAKWSASPGFGGSMAAASVQSYGGTFQQAFEMNRQRGMSIEDAAQRAELPALLGGLSTAFAMKIFGATGVESIFAKAGGPTISQLVKRAGSVGGVVNALKDKEFRNVFNMLLKNGAKQGAYEAMEEGFDQFLQGLTAQMTYNPEKTLVEVMGDTLKAGGWGSLLGAGVPALRGAARLRKFREDFAAGKAEGGQPPAPGAPSGPEGPVWQDNPDGSMSTTDEGAEEWANQNGEQFSSVNVATVKGKKMVTVRPKPPEVDPSNVTQQGPSTLDKWKVPPEDVAGVNAEVGQSDLSDAGKQKAEALVGVATGNATPEQLTLLGIETDEDGKMTVAKTDEPAAVEIVDGVPVLTEQAKRELAEAAPTTAPTLLDQLKAQEREMLKRGELPPIELVDQIRAEQEKAPVVATPTPPAETAKPKGLFTTPETVKVTAPTDVVEDTDAVMAKVGDGPNLPFLREKLDAEKVNVPDDLRKKGVLAIRWDDSLGGRYWFVMDSRKNGDKLTDEFVKLGAGTGINEVGGGALVNLRSPKDSTAATALGLKFSDTTAQAPNIPATTTVASQSPDVATPKGTGAAGASPTWSVEIKRGGKVVGTERVSAPSLPEAKKVAVKTVLQKGQTLGTVTQIEGGTTETAPTPEVKLMNVPNNGPEMNAALVTHLTSVVGATPQDVKVVADALTGPLVRWRRAFPGLALRSDKSTRGSGLSLVPVPAENRNAIQIDGQVILNAKNPKLKQWADAVVLEEVIHHIADELNLDVAGLWDRLSAKGKKLVMQSYQGENAKPGDRTDLAWGHEFLRMLVQDKLPGSAVTELFQQGADTIEFVKGILKKLLTFLSDLAKREPAIAEKAIEYRDMVIERLKALDESVKRGSSASPMTPTPPITPAAAAAATVLRRTVEINDQKVTLTPEQAAEWDAEKARHARDVELIKKMNDRTDIRNGKLKAAGMKHSANLRKIAGVMTSKEKQAKQVDDVTLRVGRTVTDEDGNTGEITKAPAFGKVRVRFADGERSVAASSVTVVEPTAAATISPTPEQPLQTGSRTGTNQPKGEAGSETKALASEVTPSAGVGEGITLDTADGELTIEDFDIDYWLNGESYPGVPSRKDKYRPGNTPWGKDPAKGQGVKLARGKKQLEANIQQFNDEIYPSIAGKLNAEQLFRIYKATGNEDALRRSEYRLWKKDDKQSWLPKGDPNEQKAIELGATVVEAKPNPTETPKPEIPDATEGRGGSVAVAPQGPLTQPNLIDVPAEKRKGMALRAAMERRLGELENQMILDNYGEDYFEGLTAEERDGAKATALADLDNLMDTPVSRAVMELRKRISQLVAAEIQSRGGQVGPASLEMPRESSINTPVRVDRTPRETPEEQLAGRQATSGFAYGKAVRGETLTQKEVDSLPVALPSGYVKEGGSYVYMPNLAKELAAKEQATQQSTTETPQGQRDLTKPEPEQKPTVSIASETIRRFNYGFSKLGGVKTQAEERKFLAKVAEALKPIGIKSYMIGEAVQSIRGQNQSGRVRLIGFDEMIRQLVKQGDVVPDKDGGGNTAPKEPLSSGPSKVSDAEFQRRVDEAAKEKPGEYVTGNPLRAMSTNTAADRVIDEEYESNEARLSRAELEKQSDAEFQDRFQSSPNKVIQFVIDIAAAGNALDAPQTVLAMRFIKALSEDLTTPEKLSYYREVKYAYRLARRELAQAMQAGTDPWMTRTERNKMFLENKILHPGAEEQVRINAKAEAAKLKALQLGKSKAEAEAAAKAVQDAELRRDAETRLKTLETLLAKNGLTIDDLINGDYKITPESDAFETALSSFEAWQQDAIRQMVGGDKDFKTIAKNIAKNHKAQVSNLGKLSKVIEDTRDAFEAKVREVFLDRIRKGETAAAILSELGAVASSGPAPVSQQDSDYLAAVERGDMETAQKMVDAAAKAAGLDLTHVRAENFTDNGFVKQFVDTRNRSRVENYTGFGVKPKATPRFYSVNSDSLAGQNDPILSKWAEDNGYSLDTPDIVSSAAFWDEPQAVADFWSANEDYLLDNEIFGIRTEDGGVVFDTPTALSKGAVVETSAVTRDADGNVIPLSQRFNPAKDSILYSAPAQLTDEQVEAEMQKLIQGMGLVKKTKQGKAKVKNEPEKLSSQEVTRRAQALLRNFRGSLKEGDVKLAVTEFTKIATDYLKANDHTDTAYRELVSKFVAAGVKPKVAVKLAEKARSYLGTRVMSFLDKSDPFAVVMAMRQVDIANSRGWGKTFDMLSELQYASVLSGFGTQRRNALGAMAGITMHMGPTRLMEAMVSRTLLTLAKIPGLKALDPKDQAVAFNEIPKSLMNLWDSGLRDAWDAAKRTFSTEFDLFGLESDNPDLRSEGLSAEELYGMRGSPGPRIVGSFENSPKLNRAVDAAGRTIRLPLRAMAASDAFMKNAAAIMEVHNFAMRIARAEARKDPSMSEDDIRARAMLLAADKTSLAWTRAVAKARYYAAQQQYNAENPLERILKGLDESLSRTYQGFAKNALRYAVKTMFFMFLRTPYNLTKIAASFTPAMAAYHLLYKTPSIAVKTIKASRNIAKDVKELRIKLTAREAAKDTAGAAKIQGEIDALMIDNNFYDNYPEFITNTAKSLLGLALMGVLKGIVEGDDDDDDKNILFVSSRLPARGDSGENLVRDVTTGGSNYYFRFGGKNGFKLSINGMDPHTSTLALVADYQRVAKIDGLEASERAAKAFGFISRRLEDTTYLKGIGNLAKMSNGEMQLDEFLESWTAWVVPNLAKEIARANNPTMSEFGTASYGEKLLPTGSDAAQKVNLAGETMEKGGGNWVARFLWDYANKTGEQPVWLRGLANWNQKMLGKKDSKNESATYGPTILRTREKEVKFPDGTVKTVELTTKQVEDYNLEVASLANRMLRGQFREADVTTFNEAKVDRVKDAWSEAKRKVGEKWNRVLVSQERAKPVK